jgi:hypothetical protein
MFLDGLVPMLLLLLLRVNSLRGIDCNCRNRKRHFLIEKSE